MIQMLTFLQESAISIWLREGESIWALPTVLTLHTLGMMVLAGASAVVDLRLLGIGRQIPLGPLRSFFQVMWIGFAINAVTGTLLFVADAVKRGTSLFFLMKLLFVAIGVVTLVLIKRSLYDDGGQPVTVSPKVKLLAIASLLAWAAAITTGRLLAYVV